jgi:cobyrinic acid a,c-diamide synthase
VSGIPTLLVAAPGSGHGKTTVMCGLAAALRRSGVDVRAFKAGPDYLDPTWHAVATGRPSRNLDAWMTGPDGVRATFARGAAGGDLALVEGVMGLFDGRDPRALDGSGAELALLLGAPVLLVMDASGMARTAAALVEGLARHVPGVRVTGVVFNRVGSRGHTALLAEALEGSGIPVLGGLPKAPALTLPERHLGLHAADTGAGALVAAIADHVAEHVDLDAVRRLAVPVHVGDTPCETSDVSPPARVRIGVARDAAFSFYYEDNLYLLVAAGAELVPFSPLADATLPPVDGLYLGGGYPEAHAATLAANTSLRAAVRAFDGPVYAECGGLMFLGEALDDAPMCGVLPLRTRMGDRLRALGYREVVTTRDTVLGPAGTRFRGHEFHYSELAAPPDLAPAYAMTGRRGVGVEGWARGNVLGSYVHAHFGSNPSLATNLVAACRRARTGGAP